MPEPAPVAAPAPPIPLQRAELWLKERRRFILAVLAAASIAIRLLTWAQLSDTPCVHAHEWSQTDMHFFDEWARAIAAGDWLSNAEYHPLMEWQKDVAKQWFGENPGERALHPGTEEEAARGLWNGWLGGKRFHQEPLYVYLVAITYKVFGADARGVFLWQAALGVLSNLLIYLLARRCFGELAGVIAAVFALFYAPLFFYEFALVRTTLTVFIGLGLAWLADRALEKGALREWFLAGLAFGAALLCQTTFATFILGSAILLVLRYRQDRRRLLRFAAVMAAGVAIGIAPLVIRNVAVGAPALAWSGVGPFTFLSDNEASFDPAAGSQGLSESQVRIMGRTNGRMSAIVEECLKSHPSGGWLWLMARKFAMMWHWYEEPDNQNFYYSRLHSSMLAHAPFTFFVISPLALVGLALASTDLRRSALLFLMVVGGVAVGVLALPLSRYRVPFVAAMIPFAAFAVVRAAMWASSRNWKPLAVLAAATGLLFAWTSRPLPPGHPLIFVAEYVAPYGYFWSPRLQKARSAGEALQIMEASLRVEPPELAELAKRPRIVSSYQVELAGAYVRIYRTYAQVLGAAGRKEDAERALRFSELLGTVAGLVPAKP
jgi:4-amino-4-deoxy-L-arabinose transferase-like glycosyltransferase